MKVIFAYVMVQVLDMAVTIQTGGSTKPAASLYPFYEAKEVLRTIIMVTDEEENGSIHNMRYDMEKNEKGVSKCIAYKLREGQ